MLVALLCTVLVHKTENRLLNLFKTPRLFPSRALNQMILLANIQQPLGIIYFVFNLLNSFKRNKRHVGDSLWHVSLRVWD